MGTPVAEIVLSIAVTSLKQYAEWRLGAVAVLAVLLLEVGARAHNRACTCLGTAMLLLPAALS